ncbi:M4 family metallopeptidase [Mycobacterium sp. SMC-4]|uniref:M4 family metallopeptidase n=1 Tax=Mycobacterium sp. SMC-4 TaxID=2857059 RepID=UPI003D0148FB
MQKPGDPWRVLGVGLVAAGIGVGIVAGAPAAVASPSESSDSQGSSDSSASQGPSGKSAPRAERRTATDGTRTTERRRSARAADPYTRDEKPARSTVREPRAEIPEVTETLEADAAEPDPIATRVTETESGEATSSAKAVTPVTLRSVVAQRPVTVADVVTDTLTWVGLRGIADDLPLPAAPVSSLLESLWLGVRQSQYTWNNQRPRADVTMSGPGPDGDITGNFNAVDYDDVALTYALRTGPAHGTVALDRAGGFVYTPDGSGRADTFTVTVDDTVGNPFHVHGLLGLLGLGGPTRVVVTIAATAARAGGDDDVAIVTDDQGRIRAVDGRFTDRRVNTTADAAEVLNAMAVTLGIAENFARASGITVGTVGKGSSTEITYRFTESIGGVEVLGSQVILVTDLTGVVTGLFNNYRGVGQSFDVTPDATLDEIDEVRRFARGIFPETSLHTAELVVYALDDRDPRLAWRVIVERPETGEPAPSGETLVFHADGPYVGEVIVTSAGASAYTVTGYARDWLGDYREITTETREVSWLRIREMYDAARNIATYRTSYPLFGRLGPVLPGRVIKRGWFGWDRAAVSAHANAAAVYDFFATVLGRDSFDDRGALIEVSIRYSPARSAAYANAFWDPIRRQFVFGNGGYLQAALDVVGHEFTHAVVTSVVGGGLPVLDHAESGALNEAYADILGMLIEGKQGRDRWLIGEDSELGAIRDLADPGSMSTSLGPYRAHYADRYDLPGDDHGEHLNSTIFSHAAYRMMTDPATAAVTDDMWATLFYQSLSKLGAAAMFVDGRAAVVNTAAQVLKWTPAQVAAIEKAFDDVGIRTGKTSLTVAA